MRKGKEGILFCGLKYVTCGKVREGKGKNIQYRYICVYIYKYRAKKEARYKESWETKRDNPEYTKIRLL